MLIAINLKHVCSVSVYWVRLERQQSSESNLYRTLEWDRRWKFVRNPYQKKSISSGESRTPLFSLLNLHLTILPQWTMVLTSPWTVCLLCEYAHGVTIRRASWTLLNNSYSDAFLNFLALGDFSLICCLSFSLPTDALQNVFLAHQNF